MQAKVGTKIFFRTGLTALTDMPADDSHKAIGS